MSEQPPQDPYGQQPPPAPPGYGQQPPPAYGQQPYAGAYQASPHKPIDLAKLVGIGAWVVLGLFTLNYLYFIANDDNGGEFVDRFFGGMDTLGVGVFYAGVLHAVSVWLDRSQRAG